MVLTLFMLCVVAWVGSFWREPALYYRGRANALVVAGVVDSIVFRMASYEDQARNTGVFPQLLAADAKRTQEDYQATPHHLLGFAYEDLSPGPHLLSPHSREVAVWVPFWFPSVLLAVLLWQVWRKTGHKYHGKGFPMELPPPAPLKPQ
ncbi:MAG TPA: hypothetical protein VGN88_06475 [Phycisphaerae bacterium]